MGRWPNKLTQPAHPHLMKLAFPASHALHINARAAFFKHHRRLNLGLHQGQGGQPPVTIKVAGTVYDQPERTCQCCGPCCSFKHTVTVQQSPCTPTISQWPCCVGSLQVQPHQDHQD